MKPIRTPLLATAVALALGSSAFAQQGPMPGQGMPQARMQHMREHMAERHARHLSELKGKLQLEASQESAWKTFADAMQAPLAPPARPERAALEKLTTPERIDQMQALHAQRDAEMKKRGDATKAFYAGLNAEQKKTFDLETARFMQQGPGMRHHLPH